VPADTAAVAYIMRNDGRPASDLRVGIADESGPVTGGRRKGAYSRDDQVAVRLDSVVEAGIEDASVCLENRGRETLRVAGVFTGPQENVASVDVVPQQGRARIAYLRPGSESWWELVPTIVHRFGLGKGDMLGSWAIGLVALLMIAAWASAAYALVRRDA
jgi:hypothetical protein